MAIYDKTATNKLLSGKYLNNFCLFVLFAKKNAIEDFVAQIGSPRKWLFFVYKYSTVFFSFFFKLVVPHLSLFNHLV